MKVSSLFSWRRDGLPALNALVMALKGKDQSEPWLELATWFVQQFPAPREGVIIPVPGPHALGWGRALAHWTGLPLREALMKTTLRENKALARAERSKLRFHLKSQVRSCTKYIIVDDIITTGATARAAYGALGRPRNCEVWCLMDRRPWQGQRPLL